jgi:hypothetical protein
MSAREQRTHLPCLLHAPGKVSKASWVFLQSQKAPVRETIVSHAGNAASVPNRKEGRTSGDATGKVGQRRAIVSSRRCRVERIRQTATTSLAMVLDVQ